MGPRLALGRKLAQSLGPGPAWATPMADEARAQGAGLAPNKKKIGLGRA